jgi:drug/metabolite transporter (DMT)-like permease
MLGVLLALSGSLMWGFADYLGGLQTRSHKVLSVVVISQTAGLIVISAVVALRGTRWPGTEAMLPAAYGGALASVCIVIFYLALSYGPISIVAPVLASSASIPVIYGLVRGERPAPVQLAGIVATLAGVVLDSWTATRAVAAASASACSPLCSSARSWCSSRAPRWSTRTGPRSSCA